MNLDSNNISKDNAHLSKHYKVEPRHEEKRRRRRFHFIKPFRKSRQGKAGNYNSTDSLHTAASRDEEYAVIKADNNCKSRKYVAQQQLLPDRPNIKAAQSLHDIRKTSVDIQPKRDAFIVQILKKNCGEVNRNVHADYASRMSRTERRTSIEVSKKIKPAVNGHKPMRGIRNIVHLHESEQRETTSHGKIATDDNVTAGRLKGDRDAQSPDSFYTTRKKCVSESNDEENIITAESKDMRTDIFLYSEGGQSVDNGDAVDRFSSMDMAKRHSLNLDFLLKRRSWCVVAQSESFPSMASLPGPETALVGRGCPFPAQSDNSMEQNFISQSSDKLTYEKSSQSTGTPTAHRRKWPNRPTSLSFRLMTRSSQNNGDMSPFQQRHGIHGLPSVELEEEGQSDRTGLSRSHSMYKPSKPTTPKPYKNGGSLKDLRFQFSQQNIYQLSNKSSCKQGKINGNSKTGSLCDLRAPGVNNWKRHSITSMNTEKVDNGIFFETHTKGRPLTRKRSSRPLSEVANNGRWVAAIPENGVLFDTNKEKDISQGDAVDSINIMHSSHPASHIENNLTEKTINNETIFEASQFNSIDSVKKPEDTDDLSCAELPNINRIKRRTDITFEEHECKRRLRYGVISASYCDEGSLEDVSFVYDINSAHLPRPMSVIDGMDVLQMEPDFRGNSVVHFAPGSRHHDSRFIATFDMNSSLSIPTGLDKIESTSFVLGSSAKSGISVENGTSMIQWNSSGSDVIMEDGNSFSSISEKKSNPGVAVVILNPAKPVYVEGLWDHVTMDEEELSFRVGDVILVKNMCDAVWWWGELDNDEGWFPASFVRVLVNQQLREDTCDGDTSPSFEEKCTTIDKNDRCKRCGLLKKEYINESDNDASCTCQSANDSMSPDKTVTAEHHLTPTRNPSADKWNKMRSNVVKEILSSERDFVKHLKDVVEGYVNRCKNRPDMFPSEYVATVFSNIELIYNFQRQFLSQLEKNFNREFPHESDIGSVFQSNRDEFEIYSEYCNNHPKAMTMLVELSTSKKYRHFFEACRLLQRMIDISIDGFLLTPVQKICKYPLQLAELLKYTKHDDKNYDSVKAALNAMKDVARMINDRKRQIENIEKITMWQKNIINWQDEDILSKSSELIYSGEVYSMLYQKSKPQLRIGFLFDQQLILCKKDILRKDLLYYKCRLDLNDCDIIESDENITRDWMTSSMSSVGGMSWKHWWKIQSKSSPMCVVMFCKKEEDKMKWLKAFQKERSLLQDEDRKRLSIPEEVKKEIVDKTTLRYQTEKDNSRISLHTTYRQRLKMIQRARTNKNSIFSSTDRNSTSTFLSNIAVKLTPFRKNSSPQTQIDTKITTL